MGRQQTQTFRTTSLGHVYGPSPRGRKPKAWNQPHQALRFTQTKFRGEPMLATRYKAKLPSTMSYPLGAEAISVALGESPCLPDVSLAFYSRPIEPASAFRRVLAQSLPYPVFSVEYRAPNPGRIGVEPLDGWQIRVYPVLREIRHTASLLLREGGLPLVVDWLRRSGEPAWGNRNHCIELVFDPAEPAVSAKYTDGK